MQGRDPRDAWAFTQRICGVCTVVHAVASCRAVEDALDIRVPANANTIRSCTGCSSSRTTSSTSTICTRWTGWTW